MQKFVDAALRITFPPSARNCGLFDAAPPCLIAKSVTEFEKHYLNNVFLNRSVMFDVLQSAARWRWALRRFFVRIVRRRKASQNVVDLEMEPLHECNPSSLFCIYQGGSKYTFTLRHLVQIILSAITENIELISKPVQPVNPYTRERLSKATIYMIYARLCESRMVVPPLFQSFVKKGCELIPFAVSQECNIRDYNILRYAATLDTYTSNLEVRRMLEDIPTFVDPAVLPNNVLKHFVPWLTAYFSFMYSLNPYVKSYSFARLCRAASIFMDENKDFGKLRNHIVQTKIVVPPKKIVL
jgi:hypothetical protein